MSEQEIDQTLEDFLKQSLMKLLSRLENPNLDSVDIQRVEKKIAIVRSLM